MRRGGSGSLIRKWGRLNDDDDDVDGMTFLGLYDYYYYYFCKSSLWWDSLFNNHKEGGSRVIYENPYLSSLYSQVHFFSSFTIIISYIPTSREDNIPSTKMFISRCVFGAVTLKMDLFK